MTSTMSDIENTIDGTRAFGRMWRKTIRAWLKPRLRAAMTNSLFLRTRTCERTSRA